MQKNFAQIRVHKQRPLTTVHKYLFDYFELNTLPSPLMFLFLFSVIVVKKAHAVDSTFTHKHTILHQLSYHNTKTMNSLKEITLEIT